MNVEIGTYWNVETLYYTFNGVASIMGGSGFSGALKMVFMFGLAYGIFVYAGNKQLELGKWFLQALVFTSILNLPIANVVIKDNSGLEPPRAVAHVPFALAVVAQASNAVTTWATRSYESVFGVPDDIGLQRGDLAFGHRILKNVNKIVIQDSGLRADLMQYIKECTLYDIRDGEITPNSVVAETNSWEVIFGKTSPARFVTYDTLSGAPKTDTCVSVAKVLKARVDGGIAAAQSFYGRAAFTRAETEEIGSTLFANAVGTSYDWILGSSATASEAMRQAMFNNIWREAGSQLPALLGDSARIQELQALAAEAQAARQVDGSNATLSAMAQETLPHMRNWLEAVIYAVFPIVVILIVLVPAESAKRMLAGYFMSLVWVGMWPVMFAVINHLSLLNLRHKLLALKLSSGVPFQLSDVFGATIGDELSAIGAMVVLVPFISAALVKLSQGGFMAVADRMVSGFSAAATATGGTLASGNVNIGQSGVDTASVNTTSMNKYDNNVGLSGGGANVGFSNGDTATVAPNGKVALQQMRNSLLGQVAADERWQSDRSSEKHATEVLNEGSLSAATSGSTASLNTSVGHQRDRGYLQQSSAANSDTTTESEQGSHSNRQGLARVYTDQSAFSGTAGAAVQVGLNAEIGASAGAQVGGVQAGRNASTPGASTKGERQIRNAITQGGGGQQQLNSAVSNLRAGTVTDDFGNLVEPPSQLGSSASNTSSTDKGQRMPAGKSNFGVGLNVGAGLSGGMSKTYTGTQEKSDSVAVSHHQDETADHVDSYSDSSQSSRTWSSNTQSSQTSRVAADAQLAKTTGAQNSDDLSHRQEHGVGTRGSRSKSNSAAIHRDLSANPSYLEDVAAANQMSTYRFMALPHERQLELMGNYSSDSSVFKASQNLPEVGQPDDSSRVQKDSPLRREFQSRRPGFAADVDGQHQKDVKATGAGSVTSNAVESNQPRVHGMRESVEGQFDAAHPDSIAKRAGPLVEKTSARASPDKRLGAGRMNPSAYAEGAVATDTVDYLEKVADKLTGGDGLAGGEKISPDMRRDTQTTIDISTNPIKRKPAASPAMSTPGVTPIIEPAEKRAEQSPNHEEPKNITSPTLRR